MTNEIVQSAANIPAALGKEKLMEFLKISGVAQKLNDEEKLQFVEIAQAYGLNPFKREIYCNTYGEGQYRQTSIITGYEVYIKRAERTGKLNGWTVDVDGEGDDMKATITVYRKDWDKPFKHVAFLPECIQYSKKTGKPNAIWAKMPRFMLRKVAIAQGFRLCFSDELGGMPYTADELPEPEKDVKKTAAKSAAVEAEVVDKEIYELPQDVVSALEQAQTRAQLKATIYDVIHALGDAYKATLNDYYRKHAGALPEA